MAVSENYFYNTKEVADKVAQTVTNNFDSILSDESVNALLAEFLELQ